ncbi:MAG: TIGR04283 family arsenosugar biosynthesis glycosyltransferase [Thermoplasmatota archaeon]
MKQAPAFSIIIPVLHERENINTLINNLLQAPTKEPIEIIVVDASPTKDTINQIANSSVIKLTAQKGRAQQMNKGAKHASGEILVFLHADTEPPKNCLTEIKKIMENKQFIGGAFSLKIQTKHKIIQIVAVISTLRSQITRAPYGDQVIFIKKSFFEKIGGYRNIPIMEDVDIMRRIKKQKGKIRILPHHVITSDRRWKEEGLLYTNIRNTIIIFLYWCGMPAEKLAKFYPTHTTKSKKEPKKSKSPQ